MLQTSELVEETNVENRLKPVMIVVFSLKIAVAVLLLGNVFLSTFTGPEAETTVSASLN